MKRDEPARELLRGLEASAPPPELEARTLEAAAHAMRAAPSTDLWEALWNSRALRIAWATAMLVLLAGHAALSVGTAFDGATRSRTAAAAREELPVEVKRLAELPPIVLSTADFEPPGSAAAAPATQPAGRTKEIRR